MNSVLERQCVEVTPVIRFDERVYGPGDELRKAVLKQIEKVATSHGAPLLKVEVIPWDPNWDSNFNSVIIRWISEKGIFGRKYSSCTGLYPSELHPLSDVEEATTIMFDFMKEGVTRQV